MTENRKEDLRIQRTRKSIRKTFEEMICEMDYEQISIKELARCARINRKTFYLHYNTLDDLLREIQNEMAQNFIKRTQDWNVPAIWTRAHGNFFCAARNWEKLGNRLPTAVIINTSAVKSQMTCPFYRLCC